MNEIFVTGHRNPDTDTIVAAMSYAALKNALDCKREWLAAALEDGYEIPEPTSDDEYSGQFKLRLPKSLHRALAENSKREGISMNQYCVYLLSKNDAVFSK